jgi:hypothetical protein
VKTSGVFECGEIFTAKAGSAGMLVTLFKAVEGMDPRTIALQWTLPDDHNVPTTSSLSATLLPAIEARRGALSQRIAELQEELCTQHAVSRELAHTWNEALRSKIDEILSKIQVSRGPDGVDGTEYQIGYDVQVKVADQGSILKGSFNARLSDATKDSWTYAEPWPFCFRELTGLENVSD